MKFNANKILKAVDDAKGRSGANTGFDVNKYLPTAFLPNGEHKIRIFFDPESEAIRYVDKVHSVGARARTHCPDSVSVAEGVPTSCHICKLKEIVEENIPADEKSKAWKKLFDFKLKKGAIIYGKVIDTNSENEYWQKGKVYAILSIGGNTRLHDALTSLFKMAGEKGGEEYLTSMFNPTIKGVVCQVIVEGGTQGSIIVQAIPMQIANPIFLETELPEWWKPLDETWLSKEFNPSDYKETLKQTIKKNLNDLNQLKDEIQDRTVLNMMIDLENEQGTSVKNSEKEDAPKTSTKTKTKTKTKVEDTEAVEEVEAVEVDDVVEEVAEVVKEVVEEEASETSPPKCFGGYEPSKAECGDCKSMDQCVEEYLDD